MPYDIAIVGGGPAGLSAAVNARARNKSVLVVSNDYRESPLYRAKQVDNYLGMPGQSGAALLDAGCAAAFERVAVNDIFGHSGKGMELVDEFGLRAKDIAAAAKRAIARK